MTQDVPFHELEGADLQIDQIYKGGMAGNAGDDPIGQLLKVGNQGGFRFKGSVTKGTVQLICLYSDEKHVDWPDELDASTGMFTYFGDNREPGRELHDTPRKGNLALRQVFELAAGDRFTRAQCPPIFIFTKAGTGRDVVFRGLAVPGPPSGRVDDGLVALWRSSSDRRFQNYRASFTILDIPLISRGWINGHIRGTPTSGDAPQAWLDWISTGVAQPLISERLNIRSKADQLPDTPEAQQVIEATHYYFNVELGNPFAFEQCAVDIWRLVAPSTGEVNLTRPWRDGGRDATGVYCLGPTVDQLQVEFALEAKCYSLNNSVGVKEVSRLISRLRHRQFGVFVTTSYFDRQAYSEVRDDQHPVVLISARDMAGALGRAGVSSGNEARAWLAHRYPAGVVE